MPWKKKNVVQAPQVRSWQIMVVVPVFLYHGWRWHRMEVLVHDWHDDEASVIVYAYDGEQLTEVLTNGCGS